MKRSVIFILCLLLCWAPVSVTAFADEEVFTQEQIAYYAGLGLQGTTVNVYNWGEYISDGAEGSMDVVSEFERLTGATVNYTNFESNENMYSKLAGGGVSYAATENVSVDFGYRYVDNGSSFTVSHDEDDDVSGKTDFESEANEFYLGVRYAF